MGYGSIGARHVRILDELGCETTVVTRWAAEHPDMMPSLDAALAARNPDYVVIANATASHSTSLHQLVAAGFKGRVLVEKPLFECVQPVPDLPFLRTAIGYNLRFHPLVQHLRRLLADEKILSVQCYAGQYLPNWRPQADYRANYSSHRSQGGGVLRDLSHELDYLEHLFGDWLRVCAVGGHFSALEGDSDDMFALMLAHARCPLVQVQMNYTDRVGRRRMLINTDDCTIEADFASGRLAVNGVEESFAVDRDHTYREMHRAMMAEDLGPLCTLGEALGTMALIEAAEISSSQARWVSR